MLLATKYALSLLQAGFSGRKQHRDDSKVECGLINIPYIITNVFDLLANIISLRQFFFTDRMKKDIYLLQIILLVTKL